MPENVEKQPIEPERLKAFVKFFKNYMNVSSLIAAALPIPVTLAGLIPIFHVHKFVLATYTPMFCFLILGFVFFSRHALGRLMFMKQRRELKLRVVPSVIIRVGPFVLLESVIALLPLLLTIGTVFCVFRYHHELNRHVTEIRESLEEFISAASVDPNTGGVNYQPDLTIRSLSGLRLPRVMDTERAADETLTTSTPFILNYAYPEAASELRDDLYWKEHKNGAPNTALLITCYIGIFACAEGAFVFMAIREYLQDLLGRTDIELIEGKKQASQDAT